MVDDDNLVGIPDCAQTVGYDDNGFSLIKRVEVFHDGPLVVGIERVGSLVEEDIVGILVYRAGNEDALPLSLAQSHTVASDLRIVLQWQRHHVVVDAGDLCSPEQPLIVDLAIVYGDIAGNALREDDAVLHDHAALPAPPFLVERVDICAANQDLALQDGVVAEHKFDERRLSAARGTDDGRHLTFRNMYRHTVQGLAQCVRIVFEHDALDVDPPAIVGQ